MREQEILKFQEECIILILEDILIYKEISDIQSTEEILTQLEVKGMIMLIIAETLILE